MTEQLKTIFNLFMENKLHSSVLIHGKSGIGKSHLVKSIANSILQAQNSSDLLILSGQPISIDDVRRGINFSTTSPTNKHKIIIFDGIDNMSNGAINAMLKLVEEPPAGIYIFLVASNLYNIPKTIRSRCLIIHLKQPNLDEFINIVRFNRGDLGDDALKYLYNALEADINATNTISGDIAKVIFAGKPYFGDLIELLSISADASLVKIIIFELAQKAKMADIKGQLYYLEKIDFLNREYAKIKRYNLSEVNATYSIIQSLNL
jgi:hypothetical protein